LGAAPGWLLASGLARFTVERTLGEVTRFFGTPSIRLNPGSPTMRSSSVIDW
jgi:hypothetical protein